MNHRVRDVTTTKSLKLGRATTDKSIEELSRKINPIIRGWINYYGHFRKSEMYTVLHNLNQVLVQWVRRKYKKLKGLVRARKWLDRLARREPDLFIHWEMGIFYATG